MGKVISLRYLYWCQDIAWWKMEKRLRYRECGDYIYIHTHQTRNRNGNPNPLPPMFTDLVKIVLGFWSHLPRRGTITPPPLPHLWKSTHLPLYRECLCLLTCRLESASLSPDLTPWPLRVWISIALIYGQSTLINGHRPYRVGSVFTGDAGRSCPVDIDAFGNVPMWPFMF